MERRLLVIVLFLATVFPAIGWEDSNQLDPSSSAAVILKAAARGKAPLFSEKDIFEKSNINLKDYQGKVVMLNFWATWCPPCRFEIPALESLQASYKGTVAVIGASVYSNYGATEQLYKEDKVNYPMIYGSYELMAEYGKIGAIPTTFLIDKQGRIAATVVGSRTAGQYEELLKLLLAE